MIHTKIAKDGTQIVLSADGFDGIYDWEAGRGWLIADVTEATDSNATNRFIALCKEHEVELRKLNEALWSVQGQKRMKPSSALERFKDKLLKEAGIKDS